MATLSFSRVLSFMHAFEFH